MTKVNIADINKRSAAVLVGANLIPLAGVVFFSWDIFSVIFLYWSENLVIGFYNILKMIKAEKPVMSEDGVSFNGRPFTGVPGVGVIFFFIMHYGLFMFVHGAFVVSLFYKGDVNKLAILLGFAGLFISHGVSFVDNYIGRREYRKVSRIKVMFAPYKRIIVMHLTIMASAFLFIALKIEAAGVVVLVVLKTLVDVYSHRAEHLMYSGGKNVSIGGLKIKQNNE